MGSFKLVQLDDFSYDTPQEMYADRKNRNVQSLFDHQSEIIDQYMQEFMTSDVSLELPTGSGKTLVGLLIGEFRRLKNRERIVYCCLNKQLVNQVCSQAQLQYGIDARPFVGSKKGFDSADAAEYNSAGCIAVTTYSALFNASPYFDNADFIIFDDAHSAEGLVSSLWAMEIDAESHTKLFESVVAVLRPFLRADEFERIMAGSGTMSLSSWIGLIPLVAIGDAVSDICAAFDRYFGGNKEDSLCFSWHMIRDHLRGCLAFVSDNSLLIRPISPPTQLFGPFAGARQRLYMSGTFGERGELERTFGVQGIKALPMLEQWKGRTTGRRLLMFPTIAMDSISHEQIVKKILSSQGRFLLMTANISMAERYSRIASDACKSVFDAADIEVNKDSFACSSDGVVVLANRLDGLDFPGDECRSEIIVQLPLATNMYERFLVESAHADELYSERMRNRITQALGRCTRSQTDYAVIYVLDQRVVRLLQSPKDRSLFNIELQAEILFGLMNATGQDSLDDYFDLANIFLNNRADWAVAEKNIMGLRKQIATKEFRGEVPSLKLKEIAELEVSCTLGLWNGQLDVAARDASEIVSALRNCKGLEGYFSYWSYILSHIIYSDEEFRRTSGLDPDVLLENARVASPFNSWIVRRCRHSCEHFSENATVLKRMKEKISKEMSRRDLRTLQLSLDDLLRQIESKKEGEFEQPHKELGEWLGYGSYNYNDTGAPDPIWVVDACTCVVAEDKIYRETNKSIPLRHVDEARRHEHWVRRDDRIPLNEDADVTTIFLTNAQRIDKEARANAEGLWWVERKQFVEWASRAISVLKSYIGKGVNPKNDPDFEMTISQKLRSSNADSLSFLDFAKHKKLSNLKCSETRRTQ